MADLVGAQLGSCTIIRRLGGGGMGEIYLAEQRGLNRQVAVKVIRPLPSGDEAEQQAAAARFIREARAVAALEHPNILPIYEFGEVDGANYLVMPYIPDGSLADLMAAGTDARFRLPLEPGLAASIISQVAAALQYAHDRQIMHLDVKPGNMLVRLLDAPDAAAARPHMLLADFGLARMVTLDPADSLLASTPLYAPPEQIDGHPVPASDQYALAGVAFQLLTGQPLFSGSMLELQRQHLMTPPPLASRVNPHLPGRVDAVLARALAKEPAQRFPSVAEFARHLQAALQPASADAAPSPAPGTGFILGDADTNSPTVASPAFTPGLPASPPPGWQRGSVPAPAPPERRSRAASASGGRGALFAVIAVVVLAGIIAGSIFAYQAFNATTVIVIKHTTTTSNPCAQVGNFQSAGTASAGSHFTDVTFPANSLSYMDAPHAAPTSGYTVQDVFTCSPLSSPAAARSFFAGSLPGNGWAQSAAFPANADGNCGDPYCWHKDTRFVGLTFGNHEGQVGNVILYHLELVMPGA